MNILTTVELDREIASVYAECEATVTKHFGQLEVSDFFCELKLTPDEREQCEDALLEKARHDSGLCIPEEEPDVRRFSR
jgi:hypothetical protein